MDTVVTSKGLAPFALKDAPALIERVFPAQKVGVEAQKERKAGAGQTLTALGSYWKGRKPLVLVRATVLACLLPATDDPEGDLELFEMLMRMDREGLLRRAPKVTAAHVWVSSAVTNAEKIQHIEPPASAVEGGEEEGAEKDAPERGGATRWLRMDLDRFYQAEAAAKEIGNLRLREAPSTPCSKEERQAAIARAKAATTSAIKAIDKERSTERRRIIATREDMMRRAFFAMPFSQQVGICERVEKVEDIQSAQDPFYAGVWAQVNAWLGTTATTMPDLIEQLGIARFGHRPLVGDPFCGGGSIPFESARIGCDVVASDLNPVAAMLTWGALNVVGADTAKREAIAAEQHRVAEAVEHEIAHLGIEHNAAGDRAKAYLYCLEVVDPQTGWRVPMAPSWVISRNHHCAARLVPDYARKCFDILIETGVSAARIREADDGTVRDGYLKYRLALTRGGQEIEWRIPIARLRGDGDGERQQAGTQGNRLRAWEPHDIGPRPHKWDGDAAPARHSENQGAWISGDVWQERLYCIQWISGSDLRLGKVRPATWFAAPNIYDLGIEARVAELASQSLSEWQFCGLAPDMALEWGHEVEGLIRTMGWTRWHHLFTARALLVMSCILRHKTPSVVLTFAAYLDYMSRIGRWDAGHPGSSPQVKNAFASQALRTNFSYACKSSYDLRGFWLSEFPNNATVVPNKVDVQILNVTDFSSDIDIAIYDPPYADAVHYHEITEFFIAWLRKNPPPPFDEWTWDSKRPLAIQGKGEKFRADMVAALRAMANHMPDHGLQVCMFTHKDAGVWGDMAQIVWGAGLQVTAAWYVSTETSNELKHGGYVQGTVLMVLRKRNGKEQGFQSDIVPEIRARVATQVETLTGLNQKTRGKGRDENVFSDADIQMAGYAAALEVLTGYTDIDGVDMTREALRPRTTKRNAEPGIVEAMIALAVQTANELMVPDGIAEGMWERLSSSERFYLKMTATEATWPAGQVGGKLDDYQNFARVYRAENWEDLMAERSPNKARLKGAAEFRRALMSGHAFATGAVRPTLYAISEQCRATAQEEDPKVSGDRILHGLRDHFGTGGWLRTRDNIRTLATWFGRTWERQRADEAAAARMVAGLIGSERLG